MLDPATKRILFGLAAFLATWQAAQFELTIQAVLGSITTTLLAVLNPTKSDIGSVVSVYADDATQ